MGEDFELEVDQNGVAHVLYSRTNTGDVVLLRIDGFEHDTRILLTDGDLVDALGMDLDANNIEQVATASQSGSTFTLNLIRSLAGQDTGRVDPTPPRRTTRRRRRAGRLDAAGGFESRRV